MGLERHIKHGEVNSSIENFKFCEFLEWLPGIRSSRRSMQVKSCKENRPGAIRGLKDSEVFLGGRSRGAPSGSRNLYTISEQYP